MIAWAGDIPCLIISTRNHEWTSFPSVPTSGQAWFFIIVGERRHADAHAFGGIGLALAVERLMQAELVEQDHSQQVGASGYTRNGVEGRWRLRDGLTGLANELLADRLHDDPLAGTDLAAFRDGLANLLELCTVAAWAALWRGHDDAVPGEIGR